MVKVDTVSSEGKVSTFIQMLVPVVRVTCTSVKAQLVRKRYVQVLETTYAAIQTRLFSGTISLLSVLPNVFQVLLKEKVVNMPLY